MSLEASKTKLYRQLFLMMVLFVISHHKTCIAADFKVLTLPDYKDYSTILVSGVISEGDAERFEEVASGLRKATVTLNSPGGSVSEALSIGASIRERNWATSVLPDNECFSACALIWISSERRYISQSSVIGFHAAYKYSNGIKAETGMGNAEIGSYLTHLGLRIEAIRFITQAPPDKVNIMTPEIARALGVDVYEQDGFKVTTPTQKPTAETYVNRAALLFAIEEKCNDLFEFDTKQLKSVRDRSMQEGLALSTKPIFFNLVDDAGSKIDREMSGEGALDWCIKAVDKMDELGIGYKLLPSFNCAVAKSPDEKAICRFPDLSIRDRATDLLYKILLVDYTGEQLERQKKLQRQWLKVRRDCLDDVDCIRSSYEMRIKQLNMPKSMRDGIVRD